VKIMTTERATKRAEASSGEADEPRPWLTDEDAEGWEVDATSDDQPRGRGASIFHVELDPERAAWVHTQAEAAGLTFSALFAQLIDRARAPSRGR
jgi:hypothetical protein